jgi:hypothetical protein
MIQNLARNVHKPAQNVLKNVCSISRCSEILCEAGYFSEPALQFLFAIPKIGWQFS